MDPAGWVLLGIGLMIMVVPAILGIVACMRSSQISREEELDERKIH